MARTAHCSVFLDELRDNLSAWPSCVPIEREIEGSVVDGGSLSRKNVVISRLAPYVAHYDSSKEGKWRETRECLPVLSGGAPNSPSQSTNHITAGKAELPFEGCRIFCLDGRLWVLQPIEHPTVHHLEFVGVPQGLGMGRTEPIQQAQSRWRSKVSPPHLLRRRNPHLANNPHTPFPNVISAAKVTRDPEKKGYFQKAWSTTTPLSPN